MKISKILSICLYIGLAIAVFLPVFLFTPITGGDYTRVSSEQLLIWRNNSLFLWDPDINWGWSIIPLLSYAPYSFVTGLLGSVFRNSGVIVERLTWWLPFLLIGFFSSFTLSKRLLSNKKFSWMAPLLFLFNTYILLILSGGQIAGIGLAYAFAPVVLLSFIYLLKKPTLQQSLLTAIALSIILMFDLRITYITLTGVGLYVLVQLLWNIRTLHTLVKKPFDIIKELMKKIKINTYI